MTVNSEGKEEAISLNVVATANNYLLSESPELANNAVRVIMFSAIHLKGKS